MVLTIGRAVGAEKIAPHVPSLAGKVILVTGGNIGTDGCMKKDDLEAKKEPQAHSGKV